MLSSQGTAIDEAIQLSRTYFNDEAQTNKVLVILSDGEDHNDLSVEIAKAAAKESVKIFTIGLVLKKGDLFRLKRTVLSCATKKILAVRL